MQPGKATGANKFFMNVSQGSKTMCLDFEKEVKSWEVIHDMPKQCTQQSFLVVKERQGVSSSWPLHICLFQDVDWKI